jgi:hypothetical protein
MFDPQPHLIKLPRNVKDRATGHYTTVYDDYLEVRGYPKIKSNKSDSYTLLKA